jgi:hypothetical protein
MKQMEHSEKQDLMTIGLFAIVLVICVTVIAG